MAAGVKREFILPSQLSAIEPVCEEINRQLNGCGLGRMTFAVELVLRELLNNAIVHGNRENPGKAVTVNLSIGRRWVRVNVRDQGSGFDWRRARRQKPGATAVSGRGMIIAKCYGQRLRCTGNGRQIEVWFDRRSQSTTT